MFRTIGWFIYFFGKLIALMPSLRRIEKMESKEEQDIAVEEYAGNWARKMVKNSGSTVTVIGAENLPEDSALTFISNHQSNFDIPIIMGYIDKPIAFMSKTEVERIPIISRWMRLLGCIFMDRSTPKTSLRGILDGVALLKGGKSIVIFPEGTRTEDGKVGEFKKGAFKLATKSGSKIIPITLIGSDKVMKKKSLLIRPANVKIVISKPVEMIDEYKKDTTLLSDKVRNTIISELEKNS